MSIGHCYVTEVAAVPYVAVPATEQPTAAPSRRWCAGSKVLHATRWRADSTSSVEEVRQQESENSDLPLSTLYAWQKVLDVPVAELLVEPDDGLPSSISDAISIGAIDEDRAGDFRKDQAGVGPADGADDGRPTRRDHARIGQRRGMEHRRQAAPSE